MSKVSIDKESVAADQACVAAVWVTVCVMVVRISVPKLSEAVKQVSSITTLKVEV